MGAKKQGVGAKKQAVGAEKQAPAVEFIDDNEALSESEEGSEHNHDQENTTDLTAAAQDDIEDYDLEESEANPLVVVPSGGVEVIMDLKEWLRSPLDKV